LIFVSDCQHSTGKPALQDTEGKLAITYYYSTNGDFEQVPRLSSPLNSLASTTTHHFTFLS